jgi:hypothetical protein
MFSATFFYHYLLLPLLALALAIVVLVINHRKGLLSNGQLGLLVVMYCLPMALAGLLGMQDLLFMPWLYLLAQLVFLLVGGGFLWHLHQVLGPEEQLSSFAYALVGLILALGCFLFSVVFDYFSDLNYGLWASTCLLPVYVPLLFAKAYTRLLAIPDEVRQEWYYSAQRPNLNLDHSNAYRLLIVGVELDRQPSARDSRLKAKARIAPDMLFGDWFQSFLNDYNHNFPEDPIYTGLVNGQPCAWRFHSVRRGLLRRRRPIDAELTVARNHLNERCTIVATRNPVSS